MGDGQGGGESRRRPPGKTPEKTPEGGRQRKTAGEEPGRARTASTETCSGFAGPQPHAIVPIKQYTGRIPEGAWHGPGLKMEPMDTCDPSTRYRPSQGFSPSAGVQKMGEVRADISFSSWRCLYSAPWARVSQGASLSTRTTAEPSARQRGQVTIPPQR